MAELLVMHHATCARKALFVLLEKNAPLKSREIDRDYLRTPEYRRLNPDGVVPTLVTDDGGALVESSVIMRFIDEAYEGPSLQPSDPLARARMNLWMKRVDEKYFPSLQAITVAVFMRKMFGAPPDEVRLKAMLDGLTDQGVRVMREDAIRRGVESPFAQQGLVQVRAMLTRMEETLERHPFVVGDALTLADCALTPLILRLDEFGLAGAWRTNRPRLTAWWKRIGRRPTVERLIGMANQALLTELTGSIAEARPMYLERLS